MRLRTALVGLLALAAVACAGTGATDPDRQPELTGVEAVTAVRPLQSGNGGVEILDADSVLVTYTTGGCSQDDPVMLPAAVTASYRRDVIVLVIDTGFTCGWNRSIDDWGVDGQMQVDLIEPVDGRSIEVTHIAR